MELPSKNLRQTAFNTTPKIQENIREYTDCNE